MDNLSQPGKPATTNNKNSRNHSKHRKHSHQQNNEAEHETLKFDAVERAVHKELVFERLGLDAAAQLP